MARRYAVSRRSSGRIRAVRAVVLLAAFSATAGLPAEGSELELTLLGGVASGGTYEEVASGASLSADTAAAAGLVLGFPKGEDRTLEVVWLHQWVTVPGAWDDGADVELALDTVGVGGTYEWGSGKARPFVSATAGVGLLGADEPGYDDELLLAGTLGGGVKLALGSRTWIRLEGRGAGLVVIGGAAGICGPSGCALAFSGAGLGQLELLAGITVSF